MADMEWVDEIEGLLGKTGWEAWTRVRTGSRRLIAAIRLAEGDASDIENMLRGSNQAAVHHYVKRLRDRLRSGDVEGE